MWLNGGVARSHLALQLFSMKAPGRPSNEQKGLMFGKSYIYIYIIRQLFLCPAHTFASIQEMGKVLGFLTPVNLI
jgi:hypothetical protein